MYVMDIGPSGILAARDACLLNLMRSLVPHIGPIQDRWARVAMVAGAELDWDNKRLLFDDDDYLLFVIKWS